MDKKPDAPTSPPAKDANAPKALNQSPWDLIAVGATVLYRESKGEGWFECKVIAVSADKKTLTLKWRDYNLKPFDVRRLAVAVLAKVD